MTDTVKSWIEARRDRADTDWYALSAESLFAEGAEWLRNQLRTDEATERVARALNGAGWVCMGCEYEPYDFDECESCRDVCLKQARATITALLGDN